MDQHKSKGSIRFLTLNILPGSPLAACQGAVASTVAAMSPSLAVLKCQPRHGMLPRHARWRGGLHVKQGIITALPIRFAYKQSFACCVDTMVLECSHTMTAWMAAVLHEGMVICRISSQTSARWCLWARTAPGGALSPAEPACLLPLMLNLL